MDDVTPPELARWLKRVEHKLDKVTGDHEDRLRRVERAMWVLAGLAAAGATSGLSAVLRVIA